MDRISKLPPAITETILCLVSLEEAARTSVLSKEWRYTWTKIPIPKLVFNEHMFEVKCLKQNPKRKRKQIGQVPRKFFTTIGKLLRMHSGTIEEFTLEMNTGSLFCNIDQILDSLSEKRVKICNIARILAFLSEKSVKKLKLQLFSECTLPSSLFSWTHLTDLCLMDCRLYYEYHEPRCDSLGSLKTLYLKGLTGSTKDLVYFLSKCPSLKTLTMIKDYYRDQSESGYFKIEDYSDFWLDHLTELKIKNMSGTSNADQLNFVKLILARSRTLMKVNIVLHQWARKDVELQMLEVLSSSLHASRTVEIVVERHPF